MSAIFTPAVDATIDVLGDILQHLDGHDPSVSHVINTNDANSTAMFQIGMVQVFVRVAGGRFTVRAEYPCDSPFVAQPAQAGTV